MDEITRKCFDKIKELVVIDNERYTGKCILDNTKIQRIGL